MYVNELILTPFSPFDIKCKKRNVKNLWKCIFMVFRKVSFSDFPNTALDKWVVPPVPFRIFVDHVIILYFNSSPTQHLRWSSL